MLADEVLTPDSSRFWEAAAWKPGGAQPSFDKQFVRDYLESIQWNKQAPAPGLPDDVVERTLAKYLEAFRRLTGREIALMKLTWAEQLMTIVDWIIVVILVGAVLGGMAQGFLRSVFGLGGLVLGLVARGLELWPHRGDHQAPGAQSEEWRTAIGFLLIAVVVMVAGGTPRRPSFQGVSEDRPGLPGQPGRRDLRFLPGGACW